METESLTTSFLVLVLSVGLAFVVISANTVHYAAAQVVFRLDDVQDFYADKGTQAVMDLFIAKKVPLTTAVIAAGIGHDTGTIDKTNEGIKAKLFELALHGYRHTDYTKLNPNNQSVSITQGNTVLKGLFGQHPFVFVPPFNLYNNATLSALKTHDMNILSGSLGTEKAQHTVSDIYNATMMQTCGSSDSGVVCQAPPIRLSASNDFRIITDSNITQQTNQQILAEIADNIKHFGYSIIVLHPQDFVTTNNIGRVTSNVANQKQIAQLSNLIDLAKKQYTISKMADLVATTKAGPVQTAAVATTTALTTTKPTTDGSQVFKVSVRENHPSGPHPKVVILTLDDDWIGQLKYGVPILKQNGFNATFFVTCKGPTAQEPDFMRIDYVNDKQKQSPDITTWNNLKLLKSYGYDLENHGMTHAHLVGATPQVLQREIVDSKTCFGQHLGFSPTVYAPAFAAPENDPTVDGLMKKAGYQFARNGYGFGEWNSGQYDLPTMSMNSLDKQYNHDVNAIMPAFAEQMKRAELPVLVYHNINNLANTETNWQNSTTTPQTFAAEMKWLKDNGYQVHSIRDLTYDTQAKEFKLK